VRLVPFAALLLAVATPAQAGFNPVEFFHGRTRGDGILKVMFQASKRILVDNEGIFEKDGSLLLKQTIHEPTKTPRIRYWRMKQTGPNRFDGTLTDAASPVRVDVDRKGIRIRYRGKDHLNFDQRLTAVSPHEVRTHLSVRRFGIVVAHFDETIRKLD
jgi:hypothetical protein